MVTPVVASALGAIGSAGLSAWGASAANEASARASKQLYKHRYQWQVEDMRKAGLNPMLSFSQGAPTPAQPHIGNVGDAAVRGLSVGSTALQSARLVEAQIDATKAQAQKTYNEAKITEFDADLAQWKRNPENMEIFRRISVESPQVALDNARKQGDNLFADLGIKQQELVNLGIDEALKRLDYRQKDELFQFTIRLARAQAAITEAGVPEAQAWERVWSKYGGVLIASREAKGWLEMFISRFNFFGLKGSGGMSQPSYNNVPGMGGYPYK